MVGNRALQEAIEIATDAVDAAYEVDGFVGRRRRNAGVVRIAQALIEGEQALFEAWHLRLP